MTHDAKPYVTDLIPNSDALQVINDEFRHVYQGSQLWSFFETVKTNLVFSQDLIVGKESAVIGNYYPNSFQNEIPLQTVELFMNS